MKTCPKCGAKVKGEAKFCNYCGLNFKKYEEEENKGKTRFCPECGAEVSDGAFCPECGHKIGDDKEPEPLFDFSDDTAKYEGLELNGFDEMEKKAKDASADSAEIRRINVLCIRGEFEKAERAAKEYADEHFEDPAGYIALLRVHSKDFSEYEGETIEKDIRVVQKISGGKLSDADLKNYLAAREKYFADKKQAEKKKAEEEARKAEEAKKQAEEEAKKKAASAKKNAEEAQRRKAEADGFEIDGDTLEAYVGDDADVTIPSFIKRIGEQAFECCDVESVTVPNGVTAIGAEAFSECGELGEVTLPESLTTIEQGAFMNCCGLYYVTIPNGVKTIEDFAFAGCGFESIEIPNSVRTIGADAFKGCASLKTIVLPSHIDAKKLGLPNGCKVTKK